MSDKTVGFTTDYSVKETLIYRAPSWMTQSFDGPMPMTPILTSTPRPRWLAPLLLLAALVAAVPAPLYAEEGLTLGIFPRRSAKATVTLFQPMADYLADRLKRPVELVTTKDFDAFWRDVEARRYHLVHFNQYHYVKAHALHGYEVVGLNVEFGSPDLRTAIYARRDGEVQRLADLRGRRVIFGGGRDAFVAYLAATRLLRRAGLEPGSYTEVFAKSPPNAIQAVYFHQAEAGAAGDIGIRLPIVTRKIRVEELFTLAESEPYAHIPWAVRDDLPADLKQHVADLLTGLQGSEAGRAVLHAARLDRIDPATDEAFAPHREVIREVLGEEYP